MNNKLYRKKLLCNYLLNKNLSIDENVKIIFSKDESKDLLYSKIFYNDNELDFIYKLSKEIENCKKIEK
jgi:hypothetical protein